jgi:hypothetical protein
MEERTFEEDPLARRLGLGLYPDSRIASRTRFSVFSPTVPTPLIKRDTVAMETPAFSATSVMLTSSFGLIIEAPYTIIRESKRDFTCFYIFIFK